MRAELDRQLKHLEDALLDMGSMCQQAISFSGAVLMNNDPQLRGQVAELEIEIEKKDREIEKLCTGLILRQSPVAGDLRFVSVALKIVADMERIGDQAEDIAELGLQTRMTSKVGLLSGGQRQALTLLMATLQKPRLLLLDEHTAALDPKTAKKVLELTEKIVDEQNLTAMMVTHNMKDAIQIGNRLIMMHEGWNRGNL